ncbi:hypothetical protein M0R45_004263 [Rubus argutus]|uniref:SRCR domain-containing protein n=1 Tax=Rubus argutus TaxID=59490 RepID=A0AAW1YJC5_RUBAR
MDGDWRTCLAGYTFDFRDEEIDLTPTLIKCRESGIRTRAIPPPWKPSEALTSAIVRSVNSTQNGAKLLGSNCSGVLWIRIAVEEDMKVCGILLFGFVGATATTLAVSSFPLSL